MIMKCTNCGSQKLKETQSPIQIFENDGGYFVDGLKVYIYAQNVVIMNSLTQNIIKNKCSKY